jgi:hypothetical protein
VGPIDKEVEGQKEAKSAKEQESEKNCELVGYLADPLCTRLEGPITGGRTVC